MRQAVELPRTNNRYEHGLSAAWKRERLAHAIRLVSDENSEHFNAHSLRPLVNETNPMDGHHTALQVGHSHLNMNFDVGYQIELPEWMIEHMEGPKIQATASHRQGTRNRKLNSKRLLSTPKHLGTTFGYKHGEKRGQE